MKYRVNISNLSFEVEVEKMEDLQDAIQNNLAAAIATAIPKDLANVKSEVNHNLKYITLEEFDYNWAKAVQHTQNSDVSIIKLQKGKKYRVKEYLTQKLSKDLFIVSEGDSELCFGIDNYDQWNVDPAVAQSKYVFDLDNWNAKVGIINVDVKAAIMTHEVQPFYRCIFRNTPTKNQSGLIALINSKTDMEFGLIYSGGQDEELILIQKDIFFKGVMWQELKANNGGGLHLIMDRCTLEQWDPPVYYQKDLVFSKNSVSIQEGSFNQIENIFQGAGNSSNIVFCEGMTFILPPYTFIRNYHNRFNNDNIEKTNHGTSHYIHTIPVKGEKFLVSRSYHPDGVIIPEMIRNVINWEKNNLNPTPNVVRDMQVGDKLKINGEVYLIKVKDRVNGVSFCSEYRYNNQDSYYSEEFKLDRPLPDDLPMVFEVEIVESNGEKLLDGRQHSGYIIFKYNKHWQTNIDVDHGLDYMFNSNPFGVLSYNHEEISIWANKTKHLGFYRQSRSGVGKSKGYTLIESEGFKDQFNPSEPIKTHGEMNPRAASFIEFLDSLVKEIN